MVKISSIYSDSKRLVNSLALPPSPSHFSPAYAGHPGNSSPISCEALQEPLPQHALRSEHHPREQRLHLDQSHRLWRSPAATVSLSDTNWRQLCRERRKGRVLTSKFVFLVCITRFCDTLVPSWYNVPVTQGFVAWDFHGYKLWTLTFNIGSDKGGERDNSKAEKLHSCPGSTEGHALWHQHPVHLWCITEIWGTRSPSTIYPGPGPSCGPLFDTIPGHPLLFAPPPYPVYPDLPSSLKALPSVISFPNDNVLSVCRWRSC